MFETPSSDWDDERPIGPGAAEELRKLDQIVPELRTFEVSGDARADAIRFFEVTESPQLENVHRGRDPLQQLELRLEQIEQAGGIEEHHTVATVRMLMEVEPLEAEVIREILGQAPRE